MAGVRLVYERVGARTLVLMREIVRESRRQSGGEGGQRGGQRRPEGVTGGRSLRGAGGRGPGGLQGAAAAAAAGTAAAALRAHGRVRDVREKVAGLAGQQVDRARVEGVGGPGAGHRQAARHRRGRQGRCRQVVRGVREVSADQPVHAEPVG